MRKIRTILSLAVMSCLLPARPDNVLTPEFASTRSYEKDAEVLSQFVDVDKSRGIYYINETKKGNLSDYINNSFHNEFNNVNPANRKRFENELNQLNAQLNIMAKRTDVEQIVYMTGDGNVWIRNINPYPDVMLKVIQTPHALSTRTLYWTMVLTPNLVQEANFTGPNRLLCDININMFSYKPNLFEVMCYTNGTSNDTNGGDQDGDETKPKSIIMSGTGYIEYYQFICTVPGPAANVNWSFKSILYNQTSIDQCKTKIKFLAWI